MGALKVQSEISCPSAWITAGGRGAGCQFRRRNCTAKKHRMCDVSNGRVRQTLCVVFFFFGSLTLTFDAGLGQQAGSQNRIERGGHGDDGQVLGADASVLSRHVRVQRIARLGHRPAQDAAIPWTNRVLVLQMRPQGVGRPVNFACNSLTRGHCQKMCPAGHGSANRFNTLPH